MATSDAQNATVIETARAGEPDRYLAALLSPAGQREALLALAAFSTELSRIPLRIAHEPTMGEIRLQWWRDALAMPAPLRTGHPVADALRAAVLQFELPTRLLDAMIDGRSVLLARGAALTDQEMAALLWSTEGALFALGACVTGLALEPEAEDGCRPCGAAYGLARLLIGLPQAVAHRIVPLAVAQLEVAGLAPEDLCAGPADARVQKLVAACSDQIAGNLAAARQFTRALPRRNRAAFLPLALVGSYLRVLERAGPQLLREEVGLAPLTRVSRIAVARLLGRW